MYVPPYLILKQRASQLAGIFLQFTLGYLWQGEIFNYPAVSGTPERIWLLSKLISYGHDTPSRQTPVRAKHLITRPTVVFWMQLNVSNAV